ncbi:MAG: hypothetical protein II951_11065 [Bacteroidales bacterium]|nr:hypothetical protein [Bacteroidales bacterium]
MGIGGEGKGERRRREGGEKRKWREGKGTGKRGNIKGKSVILEIGKKSEKTCT